MKDLLIFLADGFEEIEALTVCDFARRARMEVDLVSITEDKKVRGAHNIVVESDKTMVEIDTNEYRALLIPGGNPGAVNLSKNEKVINTIKEYVESEKVVAGICVSSLVLDIAGVLKEGRFTCYPGFEGNLRKTGRLEKPIVVEENVITAMGPGASQILAFEIIEKIKGQEVAQGVKAGVLYDRMHKFVREGVI